MHFAIYCRGKRTIPFFTHLLSPLLFPLPFKAKKSSWTSDKAMRTCSTSNATYQSVVFFTLMTVKSLS